MNGKLYAKETFQSKNMMKRFNYLKGISFGKSIDLLKKRLPKMIIDRNTTKNICKLKSINKKILIENIL